MLIKPLSIALVLAIALALWVRGLTNKDIALDLFIMAGQSNVQGYMGDASQYPKDNDNLDHNILFYYREPQFKNPPPSEWNLNISQRESGKINWLKDLQQWLGSTGRSIKFKIIEWPTEPSPSATWTRLGPQWGRFPNGHFGPEISFARHLAKGGYNPAIFKYSKESTSLADNWKGPGEGGLYDHFLLTLNTAISDLKQRGLQVNIKALVWIQGENDALTDSAANHYASRISSIIHDLRANILPANSTIILGADETHPEMKLRPSVRIAQEKLAETDVCIIRSSMLGLDKADSTHLTPSGLDAHGTRLFESFQRVNRSCMNTPQAAQ